MSKIISWAPNVWLCSQGNNPWSWVGAIYMGVDVNMCLSISQKAWRWIKVKGDWVHEAINTARLTRYVTISETQM